MGWLVPVARVGCLRRRVSVVLEEWSPNRFGGGQNPAYRSSGAFVALGCAVIAALWNSRFSRPSGSMRLG